MYEINYTVEAKEDLKSFRKFEQQFLADEIEGRLRFEPAVPARNRKKLRPNDLAEWELRIDRFRVFYDVQDVVKIVKVVAIGQKQGNKVIVHGEEYDL
jgi:mRNA-degrading endonuclease RelE of RelBE toxin-antitoxin system